MTLIQSRNLVYRTFNFDIYSFVIKIALLVLIEIIIPAPGIIKPIVELPIVDPDPIKISISVIINNIFFLFDLYFFS